MSNLFDAYYNDNSPAASSNEDITTWDTSGVTTMRLMFYRASAFDQDLGCTTRSTRPSARRRRAAS